MSAIIWPLLCLLFLKTLSFAYLLAVKKIDDRWASGAYHHAAAYFLFFFPQGNHSTTCVTSACSRRLCHGPWTIPRPACPKALLSHLLRHRPLPPTPIPGACGMEMLRAPCASARRQCLCSRSQVVVLPILPVRIQRLGKVKVLADFHSSIQEYIGYVATVADLRFKFKVCHQKF